MQLGILTKIQKKTWTEVCPYYSAVKCCIKSNIQNFYSLLQKSIFQSRNLCLIYLSSKFWIKIEILDKNVPIDLTNFDSRILKHCIVLVLVSFDLDIDTVYTFIRSTPEYYLSILFVELTDYSIRINLW